MKKTLYILIILFIQSSQAQNKKLLQGTWIRNEEEKDLILSKNGTAKYTFIDDKLYISTSLTSLGFPDQMKVVDDKIILTYFTLLIEKLDDKNLVVAEPKKGILKEYWPRFHFIKEEEYIKQVDLKSNAYYIKEMDTIYKKSATTYATPKTNSEIDDINTLMKAANDPGFLYVTYVVDENGEVKNIEILHHINKESDKITTKIIKDSNKKWVTHKVASKSIKVQENIQISNSFNFSENYQIRFISAMDFYEQNEFEKAIKELRECRTLASDKSNIDYHLHLCYLKLGQTEVSTIYKQNVQKTSLAYLLDN